MPVTIAVNGQDVQATYGFWVEQLPEFIDPPGVKVQLTPLPGRAGAVAVGPVLTGERVLTLAGTFVQTSVAARRTAEDAFKDLLASGLLELTVDDGITAARTIRGYAVAPQFRPVGYHPLTTTPRLSVQLTCPEPVWRDAAGMLPYAFGATRTAIPLGTAPSAGVIKLYGAATNPTLTYRAANGTVVGTMGFTVTLDANDYLELDLRRRLITLSNNGSASSGMSLRTAGAFFALDSQDGDIPNGVYPTLEVSAGTGEAFITRHWL